MCVHRESNAQRAVKVLRKSNMDEDEKRMLFNEINILKEIVSYNPLTFMFSLAKIISESVGSIQLSIRDYTLIHLILCRTIQTSSKCTNSLRTRKDTILLQSKWDILLLLCLTIVLTYRICKGGELFDEILQRGKFSERDAAVLMKQVLQCINYCH